MLDFIDGFLNRITMYRLVMYFLAILIGIALIFGALGILPYNPLGLLVSAAIILTACWAVNEFFAKALSIPANTESFYITAFILTLIITPIKLHPFDLAGLGFILLASALAMASKYILAINKKHIFNPAALAVALTAFTIGGYASWWVGGNLPMLAFVVAGGLLVVRKLKRFDLVLSFFAAALASIILSNLSFDPWTTAQKALIHTSLLFVGFIMVTEPSTTPPRRPLRIVCGALIGALFSPAIHFGSVYSTPELAILVGNIFSYIVSPKSKYALKLKSKTKFGGDIYDFAFETKKKVNFQPGQYLEWTLGHDKPDLRGNRRYFTIASSPTEDDLHLGVKFYENSSTFKKKMLAMESTDTMLAGQLAGDFTLPRDPKKKLVFIAGGIGITPFRSMVKYLSDREEKRNIILLYSNRVASEIAYASVFDEASKTTGLKTIYVNTDTDGRIDAELIKREIPDYRERMFYISGPHAMIVAFKKTLSELGVPLVQIKTDFFPGFA